MKKIICVLMVLSVLILPGCQKDKKDKKRKEKSDKETEETQDISSKEYYDIVFPDEVDWEKSSDNTYFCVDQIALPLIPGSIDSPWTGSYVYFGNYDGDPIRFRVLAKDSMAYSNTKKALFLDSDEGLFTAQFDDSHTGSIPWSQSSIREMLNDSFLSESFSNPEGDAIMISTGDGGIQYVYGTFEKYSGGTPVSVNDKIFFLDAAEVTNLEYGYINDSGRNTDSTGYADPYDYYVVENRQKVSKTNWWWLRSKCVYNSLCAGVVDEDGDTNHREYYSIYDVAPALNIDQDYILFSSLISGVPGEVDAEYKLTIIDEDITVSHVGCDCNDRMVTVSYSIGGEDQANASQMSVFILDTPYGFPEANMIYYDKLDGTFDDDGGFHLTGVGTFELPSNLDVKSWGQSYYVYVVAEDINNLYESDYCSDPEEMILGTSEAYK